MKKNIVFLAAFALALNACSPTQNPEQTSPDWADGIVWYQIFPERFMNGDPGNDPDWQRARGPENWEISEWTADWYAKAGWEQGQDFYHTVFQRRYGGDLKGVIDKLDYLKELGVGAIYFNPIFDAQSLHKYDASYYHHIDRHFGPDPEGDVEIFNMEDPSRPETWQWTSADSLFLSLIQEAHACGMKVVIDGVWNHTGTEFWAFQDIVQNQEQSPYKDWYIVTEFDDPATEVNEFDYEGWWGFKGLPVFREENENLIDPVKAHIFAVTRRWMDPNGDGDPSDGIDGWRLDVAEEVGKNFWIEWHELVRSINPNAITVAEIWTDKAKEYLNPDMFNSVMNYRFAYAAKDFMIDERIDAETFVQRLNEIEKDYTDVSIHALQNLMDSHDTPRLASIIVNPGREYDRDGSPRDGFDVRKPNAAEIQVQKLVALLQFTWPGAPMIYYGTEAGMWGADDPDDRKPMLWEDMEFEQEKSHPFGQKRSADDNVFDQDLFDYYQQLARLRNAHAVLQRGHTQVLQADSDNGVVVFKRYLGDEQIIVVLNNSSQPQQVELQTKKAVQEIRSKQEFSYQDGMSLIDVQPKSGLILK